MTPFFPAQYSTLSATALQEFLIKTYGLEPDLSCRLLIRNVSDTYILDNKNDQYIFKIYRDAHRTLAEIQGEVELLNILKVKGQPVSYAIEDLKGKQIQPFHAIEGTRHGVLFSFAKGKVILDLNIKQLQELGMRMAKIHQITDHLQLRNPRPVFDFNTTLKRPLETLRPHMLDLPAEYAYLCEVAGKVTEQFENFDTGTFSYGYCHYDFFPKNFHFDEQDQITFFDFDFAGQGYLIHDLMTFLNHFFFHHLNGRISAVQADADFNTFLQAYQQEKPLSPDELKAIPFLGICFHIFFLEFFYKNYDDWSNTFLTPRYTAHRVDLIKKWVQQYCVFD